MATETLHKKLFTVDEFMRVSEAGVFPPEGRFELIPGFSLAVDEILGPATDQD